MAIPSGIPHPIPDVGSDSIVSPPLAAAPRGSLYDVSIGGVQFLYHSTVTEPMIRQTAPFEKQRIDQATTPGEQTLTGWWLKSQDSFHGGAGQRYLEPAVPTDTTHVRFDSSKNVDVFTPGQVSRLPDTVVINTDAVVAMCGIAVSGVDALVTVTSGGVAKLVTSLDATPSATAFTGSGVSSVVSVATDGVNVYVATHTTVLRLDPTNVSAVATLGTFATGTDAVVSWQKGRLMLGTNGAVYALDVTQTGVTLNNASPYFLYQHPTTGFHWRAFSTSPTAIVAAGDASGISVVLQFTTTLVSGVPTLQADGQIAELPLGERVLSLGQNEGSFLILGTTRGIRVGEYDAYFSRLTYGPLELAPTDPVIPCNVVLARDRFVFGVGMAYDEGGLIAVDLGTKTDAAGRFAWSAHLITPAFTTTAATAGCVLPVTARIAFYVAGTGTVLEGTAAGTGRPSWIKTSRIRYGTTEPKLFKFGRVRGSLATGEIQVSATTSLDTTPLGIFGETLSDPDEFRLPTAPVEWLQLTMTLAGAGTLLTNYGVKALPGTRRQREIQLVLQCFDDEVTRSGLRVHPGCRDRLAALEELDAEGDEVSFQEFRPEGRVSTVVVIEQVKFAQSARPTQTGYDGGILTVLMRTVES